MFTPKMSLIILKNIYNTKMVKYMNFSFILVHTVLSVLHTVYSYMCFHFFEPIKTWHSVLPFALHSCFLYGVPYRVLYCTRKADKFSKQGQKTKRGNCRIL